MANFHINGSRSQAPSSNEPQHRKFQQVELLSFLVCPLLCDSVAIKNNDYGFFHTMNFLFRTRLLFERDLLGSCKCTHGANPRKCCSDKEPKSFKRLPNGSVASQPCEPFSDESNIPKLLIIVEQVRVQICNRPRIVCNLKDISFFTA